MESREQLGFSVRVGYNQPLHLTNSGRILYAFQRDDVRAEWEASFDPRPSKAALIAFRRSCNELRQERFSQRQSEFVEGITDLSAPVLRGNYADAALSVPFFHYKAPKLGIDDVGKMLRDTAAALSTELMLSDSRV
jgi:DNA-binding IclR family transcriptional regulator